jgi:hypothetical protein
MVILADGRPGQQSSAQPSPNRPEPLASSAQRKAHHPSKKCPSEEHLARP